MLVKLDHFPKDRGEHKTHLKFHHLENLPEKQQHLTSLYKNLIAMSGFGVFFGAYPLIEAPKKKVFPWGLGKGRWILRDGIPNPSPTCMVYFTYIYHKQINHSWIGKYTMLTWMVWETWNIFGK